MPSWPRFIDCCSMRVIFWFFLLVLPGLLLADDAAAGPVQRRTHPDFTVPPKLRGRVNFWIDIFTRYGKAQMVVHHRDFPQIRFGVIDLSREAASLSTAEFEKVKKARSADEIKVVQNVF